MFGCMNMDVTPNEEKVLLKTKLDKSVEFFFSMSAAQVVLKWPFFVKKRKKERKKTTSHRIGK